MKAGTETGSLVNHVMSRNVDAIPAVGDGATILCYTDRKAGTIIKVTPSQVHVQHDTAIRTDSHGMSEAQQYKYKPNPNGVVDVFRKTKRGYRNKSGNGLLIGDRQAYHDYSF